MKRPPMPPSYVFVIDTSQVSIQNGFLSSVIESIKDLISNDNFANLSRTRVNKSLLINYYLYNSNLTSQIAIITFDTTVNFYNLNPKLNQPQQLCVSEELFLPAPVEFLLANLEDSKNIYTNNKEENSDINENGNINPINN